MLSKCCNTELPPQFVKGIFVLLYHFLKLLILLRSQMVTWSHLISFQIAIEIETPTQIALVDEASGEVTIHILYFFFVLK